MADEYQVVQCDVELTLAGIVRVKVRPEDVVKAKGDLNRAVEIALGENGYDDADGHHIIPRLDIEECEVTLARVVEPEIETSN